MKTHARMIAAAEAVWASKIAKKRHYLDKICQITAENGLKTAF